MKTKKEKSVTKNLVNGVKKGQKVLDRGMDWYSPLRLMDIGLLWSNIQCKKKSGLGCYPTYLVLITICALTSGDNFRVRWINFALPGVSTREMRRKFNRLVKFGFLEHAEKRALYRITEKAEKLYDELLSGTVTYYDRIKDFRETYYLPPKKTIPEPDRLLTKLLKERDTKIVNQESVVNRITNQSILD